jgi:uncharacterized membrane protein
VNAETIFEHPERARTPRWRKALSWFVVVLVVGAVIAVVAVRYAGGGHSPPTPSPLP